MKLAITYVGAFAFSCALVAGAAALLAYARWREATP